MGSQDEFGLTPTPWYDWSHTAPTSAYALAKLNVRATFEGTGIPTLWLWLFSVIGPRDTHEWIFTDAVAATLSGRRLQVGPCDNKWSFTHVADVCNAVFLLAFSGRRGPFCVTAPFFAPLRQYLEEVSIILNMDSVIDFDLNGPQGRELGAVPSGLLDLGWSPKFSFEQSVLDYAKWLSQSTSMSAR
jgi:nucleoside-diphosphate-sugar epimerase